MSSRFRQVIITTLIFSLLYQAPVDSFVSCSISFQSSNPFTNPTHHSFKMRFFTAATFILAASAAPVDQSETSSGQIEKRLDPITISIISTVASAAAGWATTEGLNTLKGLIKDTSSWDKASSRPLLGAQMFKAWW